MAYNNLNKQEELEAQNIAPAPQQFGWKPPNEDGAASQNASTAYLDPETLQPKNMSFSEESIRKGFIRKVYLILMVQILFTFGIVSLFQFHAPTREFSQNNPEIFVGASLTTLIIVICMACCENARRAFPVNFICLGIFTLAESFVVGTFASLYEVEEVFLAIGITAVLCLAITIFAMQTKYDFTACGGVLICALIVLLIFGFVAMFSPSNILKTVYAGCGALLACAFLIFDTQIMMGGNHKYSISPEEYIFAALNLYIDVVRIFLFILRIIGQRK